MAFTEANRPAMGEHHYWRSLALSGTREPVMLANMALCLKNQGKMAEARALYAEALEKSPDNLHTLLGFARLEEADRKLDAAVALLDRAEAQWPKNPHVQMLRAMVLRRKEDAPAAFAALEAAGNENIGAAELLEKGRLLDRMERYAEAFAAFDAGKQRLREVTGQQYLAAHAEQLVRRLQAFFIAKRLEKLPRASDRDDVAQPLFILGFPRSGTTLLEQSLSAHPRIVAGDELQLIADTAELLPRMLESPLSYPEALAELWMGDHREDLDSLRDVYLRKVSQLGIAQPGAAWFTDKMPLNETHLGLIHLLFPRSPLLHVIRHPLDVVVSVYSNMLTHGFFCSYALESIARHLVLISDLVEHYRAEIPLRYLQVRYEDLVDAQEPTLRTVLEFVGEEFNLACLNFHENQRYARTASYAQVTEKLYDRSRYRYRHYLTQLAPVIPMLTPVIERLGYAI
jgi:Tfp pilus assembly protein PilF